MVEGNLYNILSPSNNIKGFSMASLHFPELKFKTTEYKIVSSSRVVDRQKNNLSYQINLVQSLKLFPWSTLTLFL